MTNQFKKITISIISIIVIGTLLLAATFGYRLYTDDLFIQEYNTSQVKIEKFRTDIINQIDQKFPTDNKNQQKINKKDLESITTEFLKIDTLTKIDGQKFDPRFKEIVNRHNTIIDLLKEFVITSNTLYAKLGCTIEEAEALKQLFKPISETEKKANQASTGQADVLAYIETQRNTFLEADKLDQKINSCLQIVPKTSFYKSIADEFMNLMDAIKTDNIDKVTASDQKIKQLNNDPLYKSGGESAALLGKLGPDYGKYLGEFGQKLDTLKIENKDELEKLGFNELK